MAIKQLLIANRGEIAIRIARAAAELDIRTVAVYPADDETSLHVRMADEARLMPGEGARAYLDAAQVVAAAKESGCDAVHPGYGFLSENADFARLCAEAGLTFVGPRVEMLELFGDKVRARQAAIEHGIPVLVGNATPASLEDAQTFLAGLAEGQQMIIKAVGGGGGRGVRVVSSADEVEEAYTRARSEARMSFGRDEVYVEQYLPRARHIEVQVAGDGKGGVAHLWERECSLQRRYQKVLEIAPAPNLPGPVRDRIIAAAVKLASAVQYDNLGTFEFLVDASALSDDSPFAFIEANARLQVEHTVTEEVTGVDLVQVQLGLSGGSSLEALGLPPGEPPALRGYAIQGRVNMETMRPDGRTLPSGGTLSVFETPAGPGVRVDTFGYTGYKTSARFDSLLAKVIVHNASPDFTRAASRLDRALGELRIEGLSTNAPLLRAMIQHPAVRSGEMYTRFIDDNVGELVATALAMTPEAPAKAEGAPASSPAARRAGASVDKVDPLAVLSYGQSGAPRAIPIAAPPTPSASGDIATPEGTVAVNAPLQGTIVQIDVAEGDLVRAGQQLLVMEAMKMEHVVTAAASGVIKQITVAQGDTIFADHPLIFIEEAEVEEADVTAQQEVDLDYIRPDLQLIHDRHAITLDAARPDAVARRRKTNQRTARENIDDLCDPGTFLEHGSLVLTPGTGLPIDEVIRKFPTDGMITGVGSVNGDEFDEHTARTVVLSYDYTVLAGTQGAINHPKTDRMLELAEKWRLPVVFFTEGGGGRAGTGGRRQGGQPTTSQSTEIMAGRPLDTPTFTTMARLSGLVPVIGINSGRCFAGNAALLGCCDVIIATANSNIGMGGPAMIEGGGLGVFTPEEVGPMDVQVPNGVVDIAVEDEAEAVAVAKQYLSYFQGPVKEWDCPDQRILRTIVPENRLRMYDIRKVIETIADTGSVLELRPQYGLGMVTAFIRIEGRPIGVVANNPAHLAGAIDSDGSDKAARFMQLLDAFDIPMLVLCDTPGMMVGPEVEKTALVRHCSRLFVTGANLTIPHVTIVLRKAYGLGAQAMAGGSMKEPFCAVAWPTAEFGGMGLEGQVKLGFRNELAAIEDPKERLARYEDLVARAYERSRAIHQGVSFGVDDVIDPMDSRHWVANAFRSTPPPPVRHGHEKKRRNVDTW